MSILNREEIKDRLGSSIIIHPFEDKLLKGIGYNFRVGPLAWSINSKKPLEVVQKEDWKSYIVEPNDVALVMTREVIAVDSTVAGTLHSKVDKVSIGFSHISTTLDAGWCGPLLLAVANNKNTPLTLRIDDTFFTLIFHPIKHTEYYHQNPSGRVDIIHSMGLVADEGEQKWLRQEWRNNRNALKHQFDLKAPDDDTAQLVDWKMRMKHKRKQSISRNVKYFLQLLLLLSCTAIGYWRFGTTPGFPASVALGAALLTFANQFFEKK